MALYRAILPSVLSTLRLLLALAFPFCPERLWVWFILAAGISDIVDGWLARRWKVESWQGGLLDAVADKVFVLTVLIVFATAGKFDPFWIPLVLSRDLLVLLTALYAAVSRSWGSFKKMEARFSGKLATGGQFALFAIAVLLPEQTRYALLIAAFCSIVAAVDYGRLFAQALTGQSTENRNA